MSQNVYPITAQLLQLKSHNSKPEYFIRVITTKRKSGFYFE
jgi:hypothetical protein